MNSIPEPYAGDDPERNDEVLRAMAEQLGELEEPGDPDEVDPAIIGQAYRLGREVGKTTSEPEPLSVRIYEVGKQAGMRDKFAHGQHMYHEGYAEGLETAFKTFDATHAEFIAAQWAKALGMRRAPRPLVPQWRGHRISLIRARRYATVKRVAL